VRDWSDIKRACDLLARNDIKLTWGPIRHIIGHNIAIYHKNPDGVVIEFFTDLLGTPPEEVQGVALWAKIPSTPPPGAGC